MTRDQLNKLEADLWSAADNLRANSDLKSSEYSNPVLGLIFLKFADNNYRRHESVPSALRLPAESPGGKRHRQGA
jgi:type I restriction enzyme M protein